MTDYKNYFDDDISDNSILDTATQIPLDKIPAMAESFEQLIGILNRDESFNGLVRMKYNKKASQIFQKSKDTKGLFRGNIVNAVGDNKGDYAGEIEWQHISESELAVSSVMSILSFITSQYYLYEINSNLDDISSTVNSIESFLETEKRSMIDSKIKYLQELIEYIADIQNNPVEVQSCLTELQRIKIESFADYKLFSSRITEKIDSMKTVKKQEDMMKCISMVSNYLSELWCSLYIYANSKYIELLLADITDEKRISSIQNDLDGLIKEFENYTLDIHSAAYESINKNKLYEVNENLFDVAKTVGIGIPGGTLKNKTLDIAESVLKIHKDNEKTETINELNGALSEYFNDALYNTHTTTAPIRKICEDIKFYNILNNQPVEFVVKEDSLYIKHATE